MKIKLTRAEKIKETKKIQMIGEKIRKEKIYRETDIYLYSTYDL